MVPLRQDVLSRLGAAAPDVVFEGAPVVADWGVDPLAGGCYSLIGPGQRPMLEAWSKPLGRVFLAGEHVNGTGTIDGAIRSGERAAALAVSALVF